jgi:hypothetical protein
MVKPIHYAPIHMSLEEVFIHSNHKNFMEVDDKSQLIVGNSQVILGQQLRPRPIRLLNTR